MYTVSLKIDFAKERQLKNFLKFLRTIEYFGNIGHSTTVGLSVDGDGAFDMDVGVETENGTTPLRELVHIDEEDWNAMAKEHRKWCPHSDNELSFSLE